MLDKRIKYLNRENKKFRSRLVKAEISNRVLKYLRKNNNLKNELFRYYFNYLYKTLNKKSYLRVNNYCVLTGRNKGLVRFTRSSKISMKLMVRDNVIVGIRRAVW